LRHHTIHCLSVTASFSNVTGMSIEEFGLLFADLLPDLRAKWPNCPPTAGPDEHPEFGTEKSAKPFAFKCCLPRTLCRATTLCNETWYIAIMICIVPRELRRPLTRFGDQRERDGPLHAHQRFKHISNDLRWSIINMAEFYLLDRGDISSYTGVPIRTINRIRLHWINTGTST
jgi:hypothetical protein